MAVSAPTTLRGPVRVRALGLLASLVVLVLVVLASIAFGARSIDLSVVWDALWHGGNSDAAAIVRDLRVPRTMLGLGCGIALGLGGALMQALTRDPLADPGLLGVNAGASAAVVVAIAWLGVTSLTGYVWFAFAGAAMASVVVYALGSAGRSGATPVRLALAGTAITAALVAFTQAVTLTDIEAFDTWRTSAWVVTCASGAALWSVGSQAWRAADQRPGTGSGARLELWTFCMASRSRAVAASQECLQRRSSRVSSTPGWWALILALFGLRGEGSGTVLAPDEVRPQRGRPTVCALGTAATDRFAGLWHPILAPNHARRDIRSGACEGSGE